MIDLDLLESTIYTHVKVNTEKKFKEKSGYKNLDFTTQEESKTSTKFPNVYISLENTTEDNLSLERTFFEGGIFTFLIKITNNDGEGKVKELSREILKIMKRKMFTLAEKSPYMNNADIHWVTMIFNRKIDDNDFW